MPNLRLPLSIIGALVLSACQSKSYCMGKQRYDHVASVAPISASAAELEIPRSPTAMSVPAAPPAAQDVPFGQRVPNPNRPGHTKIQCLDEPPPMPAPQGNAVIGGAP